MEPTKEIGIWLASNTRYLEDRAHDELKPQSTQHQLHICGGPNITKPKGLYCRSCFEARQSRGRQEVLLFTVPSCRAPGDPASAMADPPRAGAERHPGHPRSHAVAHVAGETAVRHVVWVQMPSPTTRGYIHPRLSCPCLPSSHGTPMRAMAFTHHPYHASMVMT